MKKHELATVDFVKAAGALTNEVSHGIAYVAICEGVADMDPFIGNYAPVFFTYTFYGSLYSAQMHANKLFDTESSAFTIRKFLDAVNLRSSKFPHATETEVLSCRAESETTISNLEPLIRALRSRRNNFLAHLSPTHAFEPHQLRQATEITLPQIKEVLHKGGMIVNQFLQMWNKSVNQLSTFGSDDYKKILSSVSKQLCAEIKAHEAEFRTYDPSRLPRPRDCS